MNGRHAICHDQYQNVLDNWPIYLKDFVSFLTAIHCPEASERVQEKLDFLTAKQQKSNRIQPSPSPELGSSYSLPNMSSFFLDNNVQEELFGQYCHGILCFSL
jgi:hypothetical protein